MTKKKSIARGTFSRKKPAPEKSTFTVSIPDDLKARMDALSHINWPEYLRERLEVRLKELERFEELRRSGQLFSHPRRRKA